MEHIIIGDTKEYKDCLVTVIYGDRTTAEETLNRMLNNPTDNDKVLMKGMTNFRIEEPKPEECWWDDPFLAN